MTKVWMVTTEMPYEGGIVHGIYSTEDKAHERILAIYPELVSKPPFPYSEGDGFSYDLGYDVVTCQGMTLNEDIKDYI